MQLKSMWIRYYVQIFCFPPPIFVVKEKKQLLHDLIPPPGMRTHMCTSHTYTDVCILRFSPSGLFGLSECLFPIPGPCHVRVPHLQCVCVCAYTHTHTRTYIPRDFNPRARQNRKNTDNTVHHLSLCPNNPPRQQPVFCSD